ncbi:MAG: hypothetical protein Q9184_003295 [Pyrenodesmia sp. 2 TL-2023]
MLDRQVPLQGPYIDIQDLEEESYCHPPHTNQSKIWSSLGVHSMADEIFRRGYPEAMYQDSSQQNMSNMQRFMEEKETYYAGRRVNDVKQAHFNAEDLSPTAAGCYGAPDPWPHQLNIPHAIYPQQPWNREWTASDPESSSAENGNTWSPRGPESCPDQEAQYPSWREAQVYPIGPPYLDYGSSFAHGAGVSSPQSVTGALSEIQQSPDHEADFGATGELMHGSYRACPNTSTHRDAETANVHGEECLGSSVSGSAVGSPLSANDEVAMEAIRDEGHDSDYSPQTRSKRNTKNQKSRTKSHARGSSSPTAKRSSTSKGDLHQLTTPAKVTKRTSSSSKPNLPSTPSTSPLTSPSSSAANDFICTHCCSPFPSPSALHKHVLAAHTRPFTCSFRRYGCLSRFGSKNEWKRHVSSQHLRPGIYRCDIGACVPRPAPSHFPSSSSQTPSQPQPQPPLSAEYSPNDFNRKDLFTQHLRRMHGPGPSASRAAKDAYDATLEDIRRRCWNPLRDTPPKSICPYCAPHPARPGGAPPPSSAEKKPKPVVFEGKGSWDERMEHVGKHLEKEGELGAEVEDVELREWMRREGLIAEERGGWVVAGVGGRRRGRGGGGAVVVVKEEEEEEEEVDGEGEADADGEDE